MESEGIAVALGRIEEQLKHVTEKLDRLSDQFDRDHTTLGDHESRLAVLESKSGGWRTVLTVVSAVVVVAGFALVILDRLYG